MSRAEDGVEHLKDELYSRKHQDPIQDVRSPLPKSDAKAPVSWGEPPAPPKRPGTSTFEGGEPAGPTGGLSSSTKFLIGSLGFFVLAAAAAAYFLVGGGNFVSPSNIDLEIIAPSLVDGGSQVEFQVIVTNRNSAALQLADLVVTYPPGTRDPKDPTQSMTTERQPIGTIASGQSVKRTASAILYGQEGSTGKVHVALEYSIEGSNAIFVREGDVSYTLGSSPVSISVDMPQSTTAGQTFGLDVTLKSNSQERIDNLALEVQYPFGFTLKSASPKADGGSTLWHLGSLEPGKSTVVHLTGTLDGQDGDERIFRFVSGSESDQTAARIKVPFLTVPTSITVSRPFISGTLTVAGKSGSSVSVNPGQNITGSVSWQNNLSDPVSNIEISLRLDGPVLDKSSVQSPNGFYQSADNTITWTSAQDPTLAQVAPGARGQLNFSFATLQPGSGGTIYTNPKVTLTLNVKGTRGSDQSQEEVSSVATTDVVVGSLLSLETRSLYNDGPYNNSGPTPPRAESPTTYTVTWVAKNSSSAIANAAVSAVLPPYVAYKEGQTGLAYDAASRTVRWDLGEIKAGTGYTTGAKEVSFQVTLTPSTSQVGQSPQLTGTTVLTGTDRFAQIQVQSSAQGPTTATADGKSGAVQAK